MKTSTWITGAAVCLLVGLSVGQPASAQEPAKAEAVKVLVAKIPPLVEERDGELTGFDIELWREIARGLGRESTFEVVPFDQLLPKIAKGEGAVGLGGITINGEREGKVDFTHQYLPSGLAILVPTDKRGPSLASLVLSRQAIPWLLGGLGFIFLSGLLCWWSEIGNEEAFSDSFVPGYFEALYWTVVTMSTVGYGDYAPRRWLGRIVAVFVIFTGISLYGTLIAQGTSLLTAERIEGSIRSEKDLSGKTVVTIKDSTSAATVKRLGGKLVPVADFEAACAVLTAGKAEALVYDAPTLKNYVLGAGKDAVTLAGGVFEPQYYGIALPPKSPLREEINRTLLELKRNGVYEKLHRRYFGSE